MEERGGRGSAEKTAKSDLAARGREQIAAADDVRDLFYEVIDGRRELIGPLADTIADEDVAALSRRVLCLRPEQAVVETLDPRIHTHADPAARAGAEATRAAVAIIAALAV